MDRFTASQLAAATARDSNTLVIAGPGSGKTATLVERIRRLVEEGIDPQAIACLTFTNAAARELEERLAGGVIGRDVTTGEPITRFDDRLSPKLGYTGTLHGFALRMMRDHGQVLGYGERMTVISAESATALLEAKARELKSTTGIDKLLKIKGVLAVHHKKQNPVRMSPDETVVEAYRADLWRGAMLDFDFLLSEFLHALKTNPLFCTSIGNRFSDLAVDEVQDSSRVDWEIYRALPILRKFFVGDPDQSIFSFRGGDIMGMLEFSKRADVKTIELNENFRSMAAICAAANNLIAHNSNRFERQIISVKGPGGTVDHVPWAAHEGEELAQLAHQLRVFTTGSRAILCRTNNLAHKARVTLAAWGFNVRTAERSQLPPDFKFTKALVELLVNPENDALAQLYLIADAMHKGLSRLAALDHARDTSRQAKAEGKSINSHLGFPSTPRLAEAMDILRARGASKESVMLVAEKIRVLPLDAEMIDLAAILATDPFIDDYSVPTENKITNLIEVLTIHAAKGREFDHVFIIGFEDEIMPSHRKDCDVEEERRLAFVAITRARQTVMVLCARSRATPWGQIVNHTPSRFIAEMGISWEQQATSSH